MGTLVAFHYPTPLFANLADHTYVECGTGAVGWSCWGGKAGGQVLGSAPGSTRRADSIAGRKERAGITCYLVNGVCHQAANRILLPAIMTVQGARGYWISASLFGVYGRESAAFGLCKAPFDQHPSVNGDLQACSDTGDEASSMRGNADEARFLETVLKLTEEQEALAATNEPDADRIRDIQVEMFDELVGYRLGAEFRQSSKAEKLLEIRTRTEDEHTEIDAAMAAGKLTAEQLVNANDLLAENFQRAVADTLNDDEYQALFALRKDDIITVGDPRIAADAYARSLQSDEPV